MIYRPRLTTALAAIAALSLVACAAATKLDATGENGSAYARLDDAARQALEQQEIETLNAEIVTQFYRMIFHEHRVSEAIRLYGGETYIQHTPGAPDGWPALEATLTEYFEENPLATSEILHVIAQGDLVMLHVHAKDDPVDRGRAIVDIFRLENGKIVEHWDVVQLAPPEDGA